MRLSKLIKGLEGAKIIYANDDWEREIISLSADSRKNQPSSLFFCLTGGEIDAHDYAEESVKKGAAAVVTERELPLAVPQILVADSREALGLIADVFYDCPSKRMEVVGVTGTNGKTTTTYMLEAIFAEQGKKTGVIGTLGRRYNGVGYPASLTTPDPIELQETLSKMEKSGVEYVFMEVSAHALRYKKTAGVRFRACIFSNLTQDHLDFFKDMTAYKEAKMRLFSSDVCPLAIVNGDDDMGREIGKNRLLSGKKTLFYGLNTPADAFAIITDERLTSTECMFNVNDKLCRVRLSMSGRHNVYNALSAAALAVELGVTPAAIARGLTKLKGVKGRLQRVPTQGEYNIYVDFAHTPDGLAKSLDTLKGYCKGRLICLFGCGGNRDKGKRPLMGEVAAIRCDFSVLTADNPRYEDPLDIIADMEKGYRRFSTRYIIVPNRKQAIFYALEQLQSEDILLIAGKGGEEYQEIMGIKYPFDDQAIVEEFLRQKGEIGR